MKRLPVRLRLAGAFSGVIAVVLTATGLFLYLQLRTDLDRAIDGGLRSRATDVGTLVQQADTGLRDAGPARAGDLAQILSPGGKVFDATAGLTRPLLSGARLRSAGRGPVRFERAGTRLLAVPVRAQGRRLVIVVGTSLADRHEALADLRTLLLIGGPGALLLASLAGYGLASAALRPVEAMRRQAASISTTRLDRRLPLGQAPDELRRLGQTLNEMLERLEVGLTRERAFTADASHELRTPLTMLRTELELIARDQPAGAQLELGVAAAVDEADRLAGLIDDLLVLARADGDTLPVHPRETDVAALLERVRARSAPAAPDRLIEVDAPAGLHVRADPARLEQALSNLLDNALRHGAGAMRLSAEVRGSWLELHVQDDGPGVPPAFLPRAFERFARADPARGAAGNGLGLAIVAAVAAGHGGTSRLANRPAGGLDAWMTLPLDGPAAVPARAEVTARAG